MVTARFYNIIFNEGVQLKSGSERIIIDISGHSGYGENGIDIVCSGISALTQALILSITRIINICQTVTQSDGLLKTEIQIKEINTEQNSKLKLILEILLIGLLEIDREYPGSVKIEFVTD